MGVVCDGMIRLGVVCEGLIRLGFVQEDSVWMGYRGTSLIRKRPPPYEPPMILGIGLR